MAEWLADSEKSDGGGYATPPFDPAEGSAARRARRAKSKSRETITQNIYRALFILAFLGLWQILSLRWPPIIMPSPVSVAGKLIDEIGLIAENGYITIQEVALGWIIGGTIGFSLGLIIAHSRRAEAIMSPFIIASQAVPKSALAPLFVLWFGFGIASKVVLAAAISFFPLLENTIVGIRRVDDSYLKLFRSSGASTWQTFRYLRLVSATPFILTAVRISLIYALIGAIVGEFISGNAGLGALIVAAQGTFNTTLVFAVLIALTAVGVSLYGIARLVENYILDRLHLGTGSVGADEGVP